MSNGNSYYDLDAILAEEELIACQTQAEFSYLSHLDPDTTPEQTKRQHYLKAKCRVKLPLWALESWITLGYCHVQMPRVYNNKARERYLLSNDTDHNQSLMALPRPDYFRTGRRLTQLMQSTHHKLRASGKADPRYLEFLQTNSTNLQQALHAALVGVRLRQWLDWSWTSFGQDVSQFVQHLTDLEQALFTVSAQSWAHYYQWTTHKVYDRHQQRRRQRMQQQKTLEPQDTEALQQQQNKRMRMQ